MKTSVVSAQLAERERRSRAWVKIVLVWQIAMSLMAAFPAQAQRVGSEVTIGVIGAPEEPRFSEIVAGLKNGFGELGYDKQSPQILERRVARAEESAAKSVVERLMREKPQVLFLIGSRLIKPVREASSGVPIVFITPGDPVSAGVVASLARPGGNTTALTFEYPELSGKRLELLKEILPKARQVLVVYDPRDESPRQGIIAARNAAPELGITLVERQIRNGNDVAPALDALKEAHAVLTIPGGEPTAHYSRIINEANAKRVATVFHGRTGTTREALATYGGSDAEIARQAARVIDKIIKGANAGELPVERPTKLELVINLKTAKQIGVTIPPNVLARADRVIK